MGLRCFGFALRYTNQITDALSCSVPLARLTPEREPEIIKHHDSRTPPDRGIRTTRGWWDGTGNMTSPPHRTDGSFPPGRVLQVGPLIPSLTAVLAEVFGAVELPRRTAHGPVPHSPGQRVRRRGDVETNRRQQVAHGAWCPTLLPS